jgi:F-type H+/Na+-transporting ATPase subunit alpha
MSKRDKNLFEEALGEVDLKSKDFEIASFLEESLPQKEISPEIVEVGEVVYIGDGVCKIEGLANARIDDVLRVQTEAGDVFVLVLGINEHLVESVVLGDYFSVKKGNLVLSTRKVLKVPAGDGVLGRVISPIGKPLDGLGPLKSTKQMDVERPAPAVFMRSPIVDQLKTGFLVVDSIIPIGKGQRELVTGDRKTGKTRLMADIICNLKGQDIYCVYVAISAQKAKVKSFAQYLEKYGALDYTAIVVGSSDDPPSLNYLAPYAGSALAEYFCDKGKDALVIYDDLSKHAKAYRQMSLLLKRSPGRDAYPGDIFYLHSRLLERSAKLSKHYGDGSITALPMCETQSGDISEYITTNLMSITDGHIYLDSKMMHDGTLPAVNSGASVSRIGGSIQPPMLRKLGGIAGGQLARYNEVKSYETMNTEITEETEREISRGKRILEIFTQPSGVNYSIPEETLLLYVVTSGLLDNISLDLVAKIKVEIIDFYRKNLESLAEFTDSAMSMIKEVEELNFPFINDLLILFFSQYQTDSVNALKDAFHKKNNPIQSIQPQEEDNKEDELKKVEAGSQTEEVQKTEDKDGHA